MSEVIREGKHEDTFSIRIGETLTFTPHLGETNIAGTYNVFEAARIHGVSTVIFASSNSATAGYEHDGIFTTPDMPVRPGSMYGVSKAYGEALGRFYHDQHGMSVYCIRIANFPNTDEVNQEYEPGLNRWLSARDMAELTACCLEAPHPQSSPKVIAPRHNSETLRPLLPRSLYRI